MGTISTTLFKELNDSGSFILLLDGFDEMLEKVTKPERRRSFLEIAKFVGKRSKVILAGRPGFFPDHGELLEVIRDMRSGPEVERARMPIPMRLTCLQLMDAHELEAFMDRDGPESKNRVRTLLGMNQSLFDLARRPVLTEMIMQSSAELLERGQEVITVRELYQTYTDRWVTRQENNTYSILIDATRKATFVRYLAMTMHLRGIITIHYRDLGNEVRSFFKLPTLEEVDYFSHDIRTCSFLNRSDNGEYRFIHKSFMEYFVAMEFERMDESPFATTFNKPLIPEMISFLDPIAFAVADYRGIHRLLLEATQELKENAIARQHFDRAAMHRDFEMTLRKYDPTPKYDSMRRREGAPATDRIKGFVSHYAEEPRASIPEVERESYAKLVAALHAAMQHPNRVPSG